MAQEKSHAVALESRSLEILIPILSLASLFGSLWVAEKSHRLAFKVLGHSFFVFTSVLLMLHVIPGFPNFKLIDAVHFAEDSRPFTMYLNFDKPWIGLAILAVIGPKAFGLNFQNLKVTLATSLACCLVLIGLATAIGYIRFDPKWPHEVYVWAANNLLLVCMAEELFFRGYIQNKIAQVFTANSIKPHWAIALSALIFGLAHFTGGAAYMVVSTIAGLFYGYAYWKTQRIEAAILTHFSLNLVHFLGFSYPSL